MPRRIMTRPVFDKLVEDVLSKASKKQLNEEADCYCGATYPAVLRRLTDGRCIACAAELMCGDTSSASSEAMGQNLTASMKKIQAQKARPYGQQQGQRHTDA